MQKPQINNPDLGNHKMDVDALKAAQTVTQRTQDVRKMFHVDDMFEHFIKTLKINKRKTPPYQLKAMRTAYIGGIGHILTLSKLQLYDNFNEVEANDILTEILQQCNDYLEANTTLTHGTKRKTADNNTDGEQPEPTSETDKGGN